MRLHLFEFEDLTWFPAVIRRGQTDYLHFVISKANIYKPAAGMLKEIIKSTGKKEILDLCSGGGGGIDLMQKNLEELTGEKIKITLSDKYPNIEAFEKIKNITAGSIDYIKEPVDVMNVSDTNGRIRTIFSAFHHFEPGNAKAILKDAVDDNVPIAIFEGASKDIKNFLGILLFTPVICLLVTPFMKPFRFSRLVFTYLIPLIPLATLWDGLVSLLRIYNEKEMLAMANEVTQNGYIWKAGKSKGKLGNDVLYLTGCKIN
jgi:hypothetical protein